MKNTLLVAGALMALAAPAFADAAAGEKTFKKCKACHAIVNDETGDVIVKGGKTGPNLWGVVGRTAGTYKGFKYGKSIVAAGEAGLVWDQEQFTAYVADPKGYLREYLNDTGAKSSMSFKLSKGAEDVFAYLESVGPKPAE
jgi:cytochrome c